MCWIIESRITSGITDDVMQQSLHVLDMESRIISGITDDVMHERDDERLDIEYCHNGRRNGRIE